MGFDFRYFDTMAMSSDCMSHRLKYIFCSALPCKSHRVITNSLQPDLDKRVVHRLHALSSGNFWTLRLMAIGSSNSLVSSRMPCSRGRLPQVFP